jgi:DNA polymerase V
MDLRQPGQFTYDLFAQSQPAAAEKVMGVLDEINQRWGRGTLRTGSVPATPDWGMRREMMSQTFTTSFDQL